VSSDSPIPQGQRETNWLWICGRAANVMLGALLALGGLRLWLSGGAGWCPFQDTPADATRIIGGGLIVGGVLLFVARTAAVGLLLATLWVWFWTWTPRIFWGNGSCWQSAIVLAALFSNMGVMGLSDPQGWRRPETRTVLFFGLACLVGAAILWSRGK
jgi:hypothetical protein